MKSNYNQLMLNTITYYNKSGAKKDSLFHSWEILQPLRENYLFHPSFDRSRVVKVRGLECRTKTKQSMLCSRGFGGIPQENFKN